MDFPSEEEPSRTFERHWGWLNMLFLPLDTLSRVDANRWALFGPWGDPFLGHGCGARLQKSSIKKGPSIVTIHQVPGKTGLKGTLTVPNGPLLRAKGSLNPCSHTYSEWTNSCTQVSLK